MPWYRATFDLEGLGFGALALVLAIILGSVFWPLGLIFYLAFAVIILASRDCERTSPEGAGLVLSPCDRLGNFAGISLRLCESGSRPRRSPSTECARLSQAMWKAS